MASGSSTIAPQPRAHEVAVPVVGAVVDGRVAVELEGREDAELGEEIERAVHGGAVGSGPGVVDRGEDLRRGEVVTAGIEDRGQHRPACGRDPPATGPDLRQRALDERHRPRQWCPESCACACGAAAPACRCACAWTRFVDWSRATSSSTAPVGPSRGDPVVLAEHDAAVGDQWERLEVVGREHDRLAGAVELDDELDHPVLRAGVERGGRLVEQQHLGVHHEHRRDRDPLLLAARQLVRRAVGEPGDVEHRERVVDAALDLVAGSRPMFSGPNASSSRTVGENTCASEFWKMKPTRPRKARENCSSSRWSSVTSVPNAR